MTACACGAQLADGGRMCAFCRRTLALIRGRLCVACGRPVPPDDSIRVQGRCFDCRTRQVALCPATRRLLRNAAKRRWYDAGVGVSDAPPYESHRLPLTPVVGGATHPSAE